MNSSLASSKRFVVSEADYSLLEPLGTAEYLIEFRLKDLSGLGTFEAAYSAAACIQRACAHLAPVSDDKRRFRRYYDCCYCIGGHLVIFIALLCVRFTLLWPKSRTITGRLEL